MNVLKPHLQTTIRTLLEAGATQREIERITRISRHTIRAWQKRFAAEVAANGPGVATGSAHHRAVARVGEFRWPKVGEFGWPSGSPAELARPAAP